ncbi:hypothetical protein UWK_03220 [Desulfocapsa sulfexigens DSM 10523]|uniref:Uncharacterized protein n=1 Tax=Desulfocapsa sulfexigens (strain DSM 10523 / SB164P1) TaxID=1167006 RepID=M1PDT2_DESSD|nr:hypothetical protein [Desulfocapsa sulfexigens]AGF79747.1 hypothetical protein UWK_03220 [Desulfocapsa sulfexigens DSM 10523]
MSGIYLLTLIAIWLFVSWVLYRIWQHWKPANLTQKISHILLGVLLSSVWLGGTFWEVAGKKIYWDLKVEKLCAKDGGVKVYETVELPPDLIDKFGRIKIPDKSKAKPTDNYFYESDLFYYHRNDPQVTRKQTRIVRRIDGKVLGEYVRYGRGGGDLPGLWHGSSFSCFDITGNSNFESSIFTKEYKK